jgi:hypothetical protein
MRFMTVFFVFVAQGCGGALSAPEPADGDGDSDVDSDVDGDVDGDSDTDSDADGDDAHDADGPVDADADQDDGPPPDPCAVPTPTGFLRVMTFNIQAARTASIDAIADAILAFDPDIVGLQEVDIETGRSGGVDQIAVLAARTGMEGLFGQAND